MKKLIIVVFFSCLLIGCGVGNNNTTSNLIESDLTLTTSEVNKPEVNKPEVNKPNLNKSKVKIDMISHAWYSKESPNEYETGESFTIKATLNKPTSTDVENKIKLVTSNTGLIYESDECTINNDGYCNINVTIAESANLGESSLAIQSNTDLVGTTELTFKVVAGNIIFFTEGDKREGNFASNLNDRESINDIVNQWCESYAINPKSSQKLDKRYRQKHYKGMIENNPATIIDKVYYRNDAKTRIAVATNEYLTESLENSIYSEPGTATVPRTVWTGHGSNNCQNWTYNGSLPYISGGTGQLETGIKDIKWFKDTKYPCSQDLAIYCVSQPN